MIGWWPGTEQSGRFSRQRQIVLPEFCQSQRPHAVTRAPTNSAARQKQHSTDTSTQQGPRRALTHFRSNLPGGKEQECIAAFHGESGWRGRHAQRARISGTRTRPPIGTEVHLWLHCRSFTCRHDQSKPRRCRFPSLQPEPRGGSGSRERILRLARRRVAQGREGLNSVALAASRSGTSGVTGRSIAGPGPRSWFRRGSSRALSPQKGSWPCSTGVSPASVKRDWALARAWLNRELSGPRK